MCLSKPHLILTSVAPSPCASDVAPSSYQVQGFHGSLKMQFAAINQPNV